jgi:excisionase family DNA binding protein
MRSSVLTIGEAAAVLDLSVSRVRQLADEGKLQAMRTTYGLRLFTPEAVRAVLVERRERELARRATQATMEGRTTA